ADVLDPLRPKIDAKGLALSSHVAPDRAAVRVLDRVLDEIHEHLPQQLPVGAHREIRRCDVLDPLRPKIDAKGLALSSHVAPT
ncbi:hypothetical protein, partial [Burkholderia multivorans]|uniref:hypothetical protein n=1 Tax=Burkholderia multivorans TaxID=87883 RepID=UPI0015ECC765